MKTEIRNIGSMQKSEPDTATMQPLRLLGVAATWDPYDMGYEFERLDPRCFDESLRDTSIALLWNHDTAKPMGRISAGNLRIYTDATRGLCWECELPDTDTSEEAHALVKAGIVTQCSFGFIAESERYEETPGNKAKKTRVITKAKLMEVSVVTFPANEKTSVEARAKDADAPPPAAAAKKRVVYNYPEIL